MRQIKSVYFLALIVLAAAISVPAQAQNLHFNRELSAVDANAAFSFKLDETYATNEWSVDGLAIRGGSVAAVEHGAGEALYAMGFRFYAPWATQYPDALKPVTLSRQQFVLPYNRIWSSYQVVKRLKPQMKRWQVLNNGADRRRPSGHSWKNIISKNSKVYREHPDWIRNDRTFELKDPQAYAGNVELCARFLLTRLNKEYRTNFDPRDSDNYPSEIIYKFALDVVTKMRETEPRAELGLYAYAKHRLPVDFKLPGIYIQVALAYNRTKLSFDELIQQHGEVADAIMLREYFDVEAWFRSMPMMNPRNKRNYYVKRYPSFIDAGVIGVNGEFNGNWLANIVAINHGIRFMKTGKGTYEEMLDQIVADIFDDDPAVRALYMLWSEPGKKLDVFELAKSFRLVADMRESEYKELFKKYLTFADGHRRLKKKKSPGYAERLEKLLSQVQAMEPLDIIHSYAFHRRLANGNVKKDIPELWMFKKPQPNWMRNPVMPTEADFQAAMATTLADAEQSKVLHDAMKMKDDAVDLKNKAIKKLLKK